MVRPLGHELHLRHLVGADGARAGQVGAATIPRCSAPSSWLKLQQNADGGWGESNDTYRTPSADR